MFDLSGKIALVTGASRGLGKSIALKMAEAGADIIVHYHQASQQAIAVQKIIEQRGRKVLCIKADIASISEVKSMVDQAIGEFTRIDILVNNAGIWKEAAIESMTEEQLEETLATNLKSIFYCCKLVVPYMKKNGWGRIINISSTAGQRGESFHSHYAATKGAVISFTKSLAVELAPYNILVNGIAPGWFDTDMSADALQTEYEKIVSVIPLGRVGKPGEIAGAAVYLASEESSFTVGEIININGGAVLCG
jgi:NAD(P)-dependent dehydrogenase (short-subunit alcohol dehydrogenase family)